MVVKPRAWLVVALTLGSPAGFAQNDPQPDPDPVVPTDEEMTELLSTFCVGCHKAPNPRGHVQLDNLEGAAAAAAKASHELDQRKMPPARAQKQPTDEERALLKAWFDANVPDDGNGAAH